MLSASVAQRPLVILTRPAGTSTELAHTLMESGFDLMECPLFNMHAVEDVQPLQAIWTYLERYSLVIFVSPTAVDHFWAHQPASQKSAVASQHTVDSTDTHWPITVPIGVMGPGSIAALARHGVCSAIYKIIAPAGAENVAQAQASTTRYDSEAFALALTNTLGWDALRARPVLIIRGTQGRDWLTHYLQAKNVQVQSVCAYTCQWLTPSEAQWATIGNALMQKNGNQKLCWVLTSSGSLRHLDTQACTTLSPDQYARFKQQTLIVTHARVADLALTLGFSKLVRSYLYGGSIISALQAYMNAPAGEH